jgi:hypothetical protein
LRKPWRSGLPPKMVCWGEFDRVLRAVRGVGGQEDHAEGPQAEGALQPDGVGAVRPRYEHAGSGKVHSCCLSDGPWDFSLRKPMR